MRVFFIFCKVFGVEKILVILFYVFIISNSVVKCGIAVEYFLVDKTLFVFSGMLEVWQRYLSVLLL